MPGLNHDFLLVDKIEFDNKGYYDYINLKTSILLHDDFIAYIYDSLMWIPSIDAQTKIKNLGFNRWGPNIYEVDGCTKLTNIFSSWATIFNEGPDILNLRGDWVFLDETDENDLGEYEILKISKVELVDKLNIIDSFAKEVIKSNGQKVLLHLGI